MTDLNQQLEDKKKDELRERLAELEHKQWSHWTKYMLDELYGLFDLDTLNRNCKPVQSLRRWQKQMKTEYKDLTEKEKDSDREWADKVLEQAIDEINKLEFTIHEKDLIYQTTKQTLTSTIEMLLKYNDELIAEKKETLNKLIDEVRFDDRLGDTAKVIIEEKIKNIQSPVSKDERLGGNKDRSTKPKEVRDNIESKISQDTQKLLQKQRQEILDLIDKFQIELYQEMKHDSNLLFTSLKAVIKNPKLFKKLNQPKKEE
jgi:hypothetical protein